MDLLEFMKGNTGIDFEPNPDLWDMSEPELVGLNSTEWWMLSVQITDEVCQVTASGYDFEKFITAEAPDLVHTRKWWKGTIITPGGDRYKTRALALPGSVEKNESHKFTYVEKL